MAHFNFTALYIAHDFMVFLTKIHLVAAVPAGHVEHVGATGKAITPVLLARYSDMGSNPDAPLPESWETSRY